MTESPALSGVLESPGPLRRVLWSQLGLSRGAGVSRSSPGVLESPGPLRGVESPDTPGAESPDYWGVLSLCPIPPSETCDYPARCNPCYVSQLDCSL
ncbi:unnamed protein product [Arctogadus glacialis]